MQVTTDTADLFRHVSAEKAAFYRSIVEVFAAATFGTITRRCANGGGCRAHRWLSRGLRVDQLALLTERDTDPAAGAPDDTALPDRVVVERELEAGRDRHRGRENQACAGLREIAHGAIAADPQLGHQDSGALEHALALRLSLVGRGHADNLRQSDYTLATSMPAE
jgi:hypothetical protein